MCDVAQENRVSTIQSWRQHVRVGMTEIGKVFERVYPRQVQPNHHDKREGKQLWDVARESLITILKVVTNANGKHG